MSLLNKAKRVLKVLKNQDLFIKRQLLLEYDLLGNYAASFAVLKDSLNKDSIVYSFGVGTDISFDLELIKKYNLNVYAFDPTPKSIEWIRVNNSSPEHLTFHAWGISDRDKIEKFYPPVNDSHVSFSIDNIQHSDKEYIEGQVYQLETIMKKLEHSKVDLLKMDIEGKEYDVLENILESEINISQIVVEFHHRFFENGEYKTRNIIKKLSQSNYKIFYISENGEEYSFLKKN